MVSIRLMTYNHSSFIRDAMDSIMMQEVEFPVEVVIGDDFSEDNTLKIIREYENTTNIHLKLLKRRKGDKYWEKRKEYGRFYNFINILENCSGKYIALLDGDDYWIDPLKLQKQVSIMEENWKVGMVHTAYNIYSHEEGIFTEHKKTNKPTNWPKLEELIKKNTIATVTTLFRMSILNKVMTSYKRLLFENDWPMADYPLWLLIAKESQVRYLKETTSVYRKRDGSLSAHSNFDNRKKFYEKTIDMQRFFIKEFGFSSSIIDEIEGNHYVRLYNLAWEFEEWKHILENYGELGWKKVDLKYLAKYLLALLKNSIN